MTLLVVGFSMNVTLRIVHIPLAYAHTVLN